MLPFVGTHPAEIVNAREVLIHGDRYFDCDILLAQDAGAPARHTIRVAAHAAKVPLQAGAKVRIRFILGQADEVSAA
jgi:hypothetical protein